MFVYLNRGILKHKGRNTENIIYILIWILVIGIYLLDKMRGRAQLSESVTDGSLFVNMFSTLLPYILLFLINNYVLIPRLLLRHRTTSYFCIALAFILILCIYQLINFYEIEEIRPPGPPEIHGLNGPRPAPGPRPLIPLPLFLDFTYAFLLIGSNVAIALIFQRFDDRLERESLMKAKAENELLYLKSQINPHFYMNMLNNIHGMMDLNPELAKSMLLDMSRLMRYMLYESSRPYIPLTDEIKFLNNYIELMSLRYGKKKVDVKVNFPTEKDVYSIELPPLLFLIFIENAFKHGVSYHNHSFISINIEIKGKIIVFQCINSINKTKVMQQPDTGIGLKNIRQRLSLLYGEKANLDIHETESVFTVTLSLPYDEIKNIDNR